MTQDGEKQKSSSGYVSMSTLRHLGANQCVPKDQQKLSHPTVDIVTTAVVYHAASAKKTRWISATTPRSTNDTSDITAPLHGPSRPPRTDLPIQVFVDSCGVVEHGI